MHENLTPWQARTTFPNLIRYIVSENKREPAALKIGRKRLIIFLRDQKPVNANFSTRLKRPCKQLFKRRSIRLPRLYHSDTRTGKLVGRLKPIAGVNYHPCRIFSQHKRTCRTRETRKKLARLPAVGHIFTSVGIDLWHNKRIKSFGSHSLT